MQTLNELSRLLEKLKEKQKECEQELRCAPKEKLMISSNGSRTTFFEVAHAAGKRQLHAISRERDRVYQLARAAYLEKYLRRLERNIMAIERYIGSSCSLEYSDILEELPKHFDVLDPFFVSGSGYRVRNGFPTAVPTRDAALLPREAMLSLTGMTPEEWAVLPYRENTVNLERKVHCRENGLYYRSKSEMLIQSIYDDEQIFTHYDEVLTINGRLISPDFIGLRQDGSFVYHEHLGLMTESYRMRIREKESIYASAGIIPGKNLIYTYDDENGAVNARLIRETIRDRFGIIG